MRKLSVNERLSTKRKASARKNPSPEPVERLPRRHGGQADPIADAQSRIPVIASVASFETVEIDAADDAVQPPIARAIAAATAGTRKSKADVFSALHDS